MDADPLPFSAPSYPHLPLLLHPCFTHSLPYSSFLLPSVIFSKNVWRSTVSCPECPAENDSRVRPMPVCTHRSIDVKKKRSNSSMHHYECIVLCRYISLQTGRFCTRSLASCIPRSSEDRFYIQVVRGRPGGRLQFSRGGSKIAWRKKF